MLYWPRSATVDSFGMYTWAGCFEVPCRWDDRTEEYQGLKGREVSRSVVMSDIRLYTGDKLMLGTLQSVAVMHNITAFLNWQGGVAPTNGNRAALSATTAALVPSIWEVKYVANIPTMDATMHLHMAYL